MSVTFSAAAGPDSAPLPPWPDVPACYGWLSLDRRGVWRLKGEAVLHGGLKAFLDRHYMCDEGGCWFVRNGPQRVFVALAYAPWVYRLDPAGGCVAHTGARAQAVSEVFLDDAGSVLLVTDLGVGLLDDRDLAGFFGDCANAAGESAGEDDLLALLAGDGGVKIAWCGRPLQPIRVADVAKRFGYCPDPAP